MGSIEDRFWGKVDNTGDCWEWRAARSRLGYGMFRYAGKMVSAHRMAWDLVNGPIPPAAHILHSCDNPGCVRPDHLFIGSHALNMADKVAKGRQNRGEDHHSARLSKNIADYIRLLHARGISQRGLGRLFGVHGTTIRKLVKQVTWA